MGWSNRMNETGIKPLGRAVLLRPAQEKLSSIIEIPEEVANRNMAIDFQAIVVDVGPECWRNESIPRAKPGDKVLVARYAGHIAKSPIDGKFYRLVNDADIFAGMAGEM